MKNFIDDIQVYIKEVSSYETKFEPYYYNYIDSFFMFFNINLHNMMHTINSEVYTCNMCKFIFKTNLHTEENDILRRFINIVMYRMNFFRNSDGKELSNIYNNYLGVNNHILLKPKSICNNDLKFLVKTRYDNIFNKLTLDDLYNITTENLIVCALYIEFKEPLTKQINEYTMNTIDFETYFIYTGCMVRIFMKFRNLIHVVICKIIIKSINEIDDKFKYMNGIYKKYKKIENNTSHLNSYAHYLIKVYIYFKFKNNKNLKKSLIDKLDIKPYIDQYCIVNKFEKYTVKDIITKGIFDEFNIINLSDSL